MRIKYKLKHKETGEIQVNVKGYILNPAGYVIEIILSNGEVVQAKDYKFHQFLEQVDGQDVYHGDKAVVELTEHYLEAQGNYDDDEEDIILEPKVYTGTFEELYAEGLYYFVDEESGEALTYMGMNPKIIRFI